MEKDAMDLIARNGGQKRREWRILVVEYGRRLAIEFVDFGVQVQAKGNKWRWKEGT